MYPFEAKQVSDTWASRIVARHNRWLEAVQKEDDGDIYGAILLYMNDALTCVVSHKLARMALSCSCAAHCLEKQGHPEIGKILYSESAKIYEECSIEYLDTSIRDSIWSLQRAYENYVLANNDQKANDVYYSFMSLATKLSPTFGKSESSELLKYRDLVKNQPPRNVPLQPAKHFDEILKVITQFLESRRSDTTLAEFDKLISKEARTG